MYESKGEKLDTLIVGDTSSHFQRCLLSLLDNIGTMDARSVHTALDSRDIIQIVMTLGTRTHQQIGKMQTAYQTLYAAADSESRETQMMIFKTKRNFVSVC